MTTPRTDDTAPQLVWAQTQTLPYAAPEPAAAPVATAPAVAGPADAVPVESPGAPDTAPALNPPTWSGRKTAIAAALAIGFSSMGAVAAAAAIPPGTTQSGVPVQQGGFGPGGRQPGGFPRQGNQQGTQQGGTSQLPGTQVPQGPGQGGSGSVQQAPTDPNASTP